MPKEKQIVLAVAMTWAGANFEVGLNTMPEDAAAYAVQRKFGKFADEDADAAGEKKSAKSGEENAEFKPLSLSDTMKRFEKMDFADEVMRSMQFHQDALKEMRASGMSAEEFEKKLDDDKKEFELMPKDFPGRHVFVKPNKLSETGFKSVAEIQAFSRDQLISIDGIAEGLADKALAYGKNK